MKRVIVTVIVGFCLSHSGYAQSSGLAEQFDIYAKYENFTYVYMGEGYSELKVPENITKEFFSVKFVKILSGTKKHTKQAKGDCLEMVRAILNGEEFELILKMQESGRKTEIYLKKTGKKDLEKVIISDNGKEVSVTWIYGKAK